MLELAFHYFQLVFFCVRYSLARRKKTSSICKNCDIFSSNWLFHCSSNWRFCVLLCRLGVYTDTGLLIIGTNLPFWYEWVHTLVGLLYFYLQDSMVLFLTTIGGLSRIRVLKLGYVIGVEILAHTVRTTSGNFEGQHLSNN